MKIFEVKNKVVVINENVLMIPEFKAVVDAYKDPLPALSFIYYMSDPWSPYLNEPEETRTEKVFKDYPGEYKLTDSIVHDAIDKAEEFYTSPTDRFFKANKSAIDKMSVYLETTEIDDSKDTGNIANFMRITEKCEKIMEAFDKLKQKREEELKKARGKGRLGYDV